MAQMLERLARQFTERFSKSERPENLFVVPVNWHESKTAISQLVEIDLASYCRRKEIVLEKDQRASTVATSMANLLYDLGHYERWLDDFQSTIQIGLGLPIWVEATQYTTNLKFEITVNQFFLPILRAIRNYLSSYQLIFSLPEDNRILGYTTLTIEEFSNLITQIPDIKLILTCTYWGNDKPLTITKIELSDQPSPPVTTAPTLLESIMNRVFKPKPKTERSTPIVPDHIYDIAQLPILTSDPSLASELGPDNLQGLFIPVATALLANSKLFSDPRWVNDELAHRVRTISYFVHRHLNKGQDFWWFDPSQEQKIDLKYSDWIRQHPQFGSIDGGKQCKHGRLPQVLSALPDGEKVASLFTPEVISHPDLPRVLPHISRLLTHDRAPWCTQFAIETIKNYQFWHLIPSGEALANGYEGFIFWTYGPFVLETIQNLGGNYYDFMTKWVMKREYVQLDPAHPVKRCLYPGIEYLYHLVSMHYLAYRGQDASHTWVKFITDHAVAPTLSEPFDYFILPRVGMDLSKCYKQSLMALADSLAKRQKITTLSPDQERALIDITLYLKYLEQAEAGQITIQSAVVGQQFEITPN